MPAGGVSDHKVPWSGDTSPFLLTAEAALPGGCLGGQAVAPFVAPRAGAVVCEFGQSADQETVIEQQLRSDLVSCPQGVTF